MAATLGFAAAVALAGDPATGLAQEKKTTEETILTADGVKLHALFHKSAKGEGTSPVVILLYPPGKDRDMTKPAGVWDGLINKLSEKGYHVIQFDWRGHGKSTNIVDPMQFWGNSITGAANFRHIKGANKKPLKNTLAVTEIAPGYFPVYVNDLAAVRAYLDQKNDQNDLNTSSIYVIGTEDTAALGFLWMTAEWNRPAIHPVLPAGITYDRVPFPNVVANPQAGADIAGCVWLSANRPASVDQRVVQKWVQNTPKLRDNNPMLFLYGETDTPAQGLAKFYYDEVLVAKGDPRIGFKQLAQTFERNVPGTKLRGVQLLGDNTKLGTEDVIMKYVEAIQKERQSITRKDRKYPAPYAVDLGFFGLRP